MYYFGKTSSRRLAECEEKLQELMQAAICDPKCPFDFLIVCGHRTQKEQDAAFNGGFSKVKWPGSNHNSMPSRAVDVARYYTSNPHIRWDIEEDFEKLISHIKKTAKKLKINIDCGIDWKTFKDSPHVELKEVNQDE